MRPNKDRRIQFWLFLVVIASFLLVTLSPIGTLAQRAARKPQPRKASTLVAVVSRSDVDDAQSNMDAVVLVENGKLRQPYPEYNEAAQHRFGTEYFAAGKKYRVTFGGGEVGSATIKNF